VTRTSWWNEKAGFRAGDIVTAIDGIEVSTVNQSRVLYDLSFDAPLRYTVWRLDGYITVEGPFRQHYYGVDLEPYTR
jgi:S1-C subfamily serine protease